MTEQSAAKKVARSPNYPQYSIKWAIENGLALLEKEKLHPVPLDVVAQSLGYKDASNGAARRALAILKAFGLIQKAAGGKVQVAADLQRYKLTPNEDDKKIYLKQWLKKPLLYLKLLEKYENNLPSDRALVFELVDEHGFNESAAKNAIDVFRESLEYVDKLTGGLNNTDVEDNEFSESESASTDQMTTDRAGISLEGDAPQLSQKPSNSLSSLPNENNVVRYPIRLVGGRMAWIEVPDPFYEADKNRLKAQIEIIGTVDEDNDFL